MIWLLMANHWLLKSDVLGSIPSDCPLFLLLLKLKCFPGHKCLLCTENALATALCNRHMRCCEVLPEMNLGGVLTTVSVNWLITIANTDITKW